MRKRNYSKFNIGNYVQIDGQGNKIWRITIIDGENYELINPISKDKQNFYEDDLIKIEVSTIQPGLLSWTTGHVTRENETFISGEYEINTVKFRLSHQKGTNKYLITDGLEEFELSFLHELQNYIEEKTAFQLRFSSDLSS